MPRAKTCKVTGLRLVPAQGQHIVRVAKFSWGALNPPVRSHSAHLLEWGRYDVAEHRTAYGAWPRSAAFAETLAYLSPSVGIRNTRLSDVFDDTDERDPTTVLETVRKEWDHLFSIEPEKIVFGWREARNEYQLTLPADGWFIDIEHEDSVTALNKNLSKFLAAQGISRLNRSHLCGDDRSLTTAVARWVRGQVLDDGSLPHGIVYDSKHGSSWHCYAIWLRRVDDGFPPESEPTTANPGVAIRPPDQDADLDHVQGILGLRLM